MTDDAMQALFDQYWPYILAGFLILMLWGIIHTHQRWDRIAGPFRTQMKIDTNNFAVVHIDGLVFQKVIIVPLEEGLYLSLWPLFARMFVPKRVLIPWRNLSHLQVKPRTVMGISLNEYFVDVTGAQRVQLQIPKSVGEEILNKNFLKHV